MHGEAEEVDHGEAGDVDHGEAGDVDHGEAGEVDLEQIKCKIDEIRKDLEVMTQKTSPIGMNQAYTSSSFLIPLILHEMKKEDKFEEQRHRKRKIESHSLLALMPQELTRFLWQ